MNNNNQDHGLKECYKADIVYGDTHNFQADILTDKYMLENTWKRIWYDYLWWNWFHDWRWLW